LDIYVGINGCDQNNGTEKKPFKSITRAQEEARKLKDKNIKNINVKIFEGDYFLSEPICFKAEDSGYIDYPIVYEGIGKVTFSGGIPIQPNWEEHKNGIYKTKISFKKKFDQLYINNKLQIMARYPSYQEEARYYNGYSHDSFNKDRIAKYNNPEGGYMHAMHEALWGDMHYQISGVSDDGELVYEGGHQNNRPSKMHKSIRFIENVYEELDSEGEWFLDDKSWILYYKPFYDVDINNCIIEGAVLKNIISFIGTEDKPVTNITIKNISFRSVGRTFMEPMEQILRSDWCVYRGGAVFIEGTENISIKQCTLNHVGGNGIFVSNYNRNTNISTCHIYDAGASSILFVGSPDAVRAPLFRYEETHESKFDPKKGPKNEKYPCNCVVNDNLLERNGRIEKQSAGICISMSKEITVSNNTIYEVPRAGINICDGTWGGHIIEYNYVFDTVLETSDHGAFNSWGRDRYWDYRYEKMHQAIKENPELPLIDATLPTHIRNNCFECSHGWDIDLDDGSSNYKIYNNLCLRGGIKNREGVIREVYNNIILNNTFHPHLWFLNSKDSFYRNIVFKEYADIGLNGWGENFNHNILHDEEKFGPAVELQDKSGQDKDSIACKIQFEDIENANFTVKAKEAQNIGFEDIEISQCGVKSKKLKEIAKSPFFENYKIEPKLKKDLKTYIYEGLHIKLLAGLGELSATGMYQESGIYVVKVDDGSSWSNKIHKNDVIIAVDNEELKDVIKLIDYLKGSPMQLTIWRSQGKQVITIQ